MRIGVRGHDIGLYKLDDIGRIMKEKGLKAFNS